MGQQTRRTETVSGLLVIGCLVLAGACYGAQKAGAGDTGGGRDDVGTLHFALSAASPDLSLAASFAQICEP